MRNSFLILEEKYYLNASGGAGKISPSALIILFIALKSVQIVWNGLAWHTFLLFPPPTRWRSLLAAIVEICSENCAGWQTGRFIFTGIFSGLSSVSLALFFFWFIHFGALVPIETDFGETFLGSSSLSAWIIQRCIIWNIERRYPPLPGLAWSVWGVKRPGSQSGTRTLESRPCMQVWYARQKWGLLRTLWHELIMQVHCKYAVSFHVFFSSFWKMFLHRVPVRLRRHGTTRSHSDKTRVREHKYGAVMQARNSRELPIKATDIGSAGDQVAACQYGMPWPTAVPGASDDSHSFQCDSKKGV